MVKPVGENAGTRRLQPRRGGTLPMRFFATLVGAILLLSLAPALRARPQGASPDAVPQYDLLIVNGHIYDGSGSPWFSGSIGIKDGKIADVGRLVNATARRTIDAAGMAVTPGFIDLHCHSDFPLLVDGNGQSMLRQGVTTEILGEHASAGPILGHDREEVDRSLRRMGTSLDWTTLGEYFARMQRQGFSPNIASYVGSEQVWVDVIGTENRRPTPEEMEKMKSLVDQAMREGAIGVSSDLAVPPNSFLTTGDLIELAKVAGKYGGIYATHLRNEGDGSPEAVSEAIEIGEKAHVPVHIFHFKYSGVNNWGHIQSLIDQVQQARDRGLDITVNQYPYPAGFNPFRNMALPPKFLFGSLDEMAARLKDPKNREEIRTDIANGLPGWDSDIRAAGGWHGILISSLLNPENKKYIGKRMDEVAKMMDKDPLDAYCDLLISERMGGGAIYFAVSEDDIRQALPQPWLSIGSDGGAVSPAMTWLGNPHPRYYGTFARILARYVRENNVITLPDAIRKMTSQAAAITGLTDRGLVRPGMAADINIFDPDKVEDKATFEQPMQYAVGFQYVIVNGTPVIEKGEHTGAHPGKVLYGRGKTHS
jgi:N-acyl-D-amino-acid deacylase